MSRNFSSLAGALLLVALAGGAGSWWGERQAAARMAASPASAMGAAAAAAAGATPPARKPLFYRNPMGLADTSPVPKKDSMGMDYVPVYADEEPAQAQAQPGANQVSAEKIQKLGVRTEAASLRVLEQTVRAAGRVEVDERRITTIAPKFEGYVDKLLVNATGQAVARGQVLLEAYSPELLAAQREYAIASQGEKALGQAGTEAQHSMQQLAEASLARLRNWDISEAQVKALATTGAVQRTLSLRAPVGGIVTEKKAVQGMRFQAGDVLFQLTDLSSVWVLADVAEQDIAGLRLGARARVQVNAYPGKTLSAAVTTIYPTLNPETRSVPVRLELPNPGGLLKPGMFANVELPAGSRTKVLTVPASAVIDSGLRQTVLVQVGGAAAGRFAPREVKLGARSDNYLEVREGLKEGEAVVVAANFLVDAESNLKAAMAGFGAPAAAAATAAPAPAPTAAPAPAATVQRAAPAPAPSGHQAQGKLVDIDAKAQTVTISHGPVPSLRWSAMTMEFGLANSSLLRGMQPDMLVAFEFVERGKGEWVITRLAAQPAGKGQ